MEIIKPWGNFSLRSGEENSDIPEIKLNIRPVFDMDKITAHIAPYHFEAPGKLVVVDHIEEIFPRPLHIIERSSDPYWEERGWIKIPNGTRGCSYHGYYSGESFLLRGLIEEKYFPHTFEFFIFHPSVELQESPHWQCFNNHKGNNKFCIHFNESPEDVCAGIIEIERIIAEAYRDY